MFGIRKRLEEVDGLVLGSNVPLCFIFKIYFFAYYFWLLLAFISLGFFVSSFFVSYYLVWGDEGCSEWYFCPFFLLG